MLALKLIYVSKKGPKDWKEGDKKLISIHRILIDTSLSEYKISSRAIPNRLQTVEMASLGQVASSTVSERPKITVMNYAELIAWEPFVRQDIVDIEKDVNHHTESLGIWSIHDIYSAVLHAIHQQMKLINAFQICDLIN